MAISKEEKQNYFQNAMNLAFKAAEGGGLQRGAEYSILIRDAYRAMIEIHEQIENKS